MTNNIPRDDAAGRTYWIGAGGCHCFFPSLTGGKGYICDGTVWARLHRASVARKSRFSGKQGNREHAPANAIMDDGVCVEAGWCLLRRRWRKWLENRRHLHYCERKQKLLREQWYRAADTI